MPYLYAHSLCGRLARAQLPSQTASALGSAARVFAWGCQGPDIWFFHKPLRPKDSQRAFGNRLHGQSIEKTFSAMLAFCAAQWQSNKAYFAYFAGFLTHCALDAQAHPYVLSFCKSHDNHMRFECELDVALYAKQEGGRLAEVPVARFYPPIESGFLEPLYAAVAKARGDVLPAGAAALLAQKIPRLCGILWDKTGRKRRALCRVEWLLGKAGAYSRALYPQTADPAVLNDDRGPWPVPWSGALRTEPFETLLEQAASLAAARIQAVFEALTGQRAAEEVLLLLGDVSLDDGLPWRAPRAPMTHFRALYDGNS